MPGADGGLGTALVGEKITIGQLHVTVMNLLGEGGFSYVYLVKDGDGGGHLGSSQHANTSNERGVSPNRNNTGSGSNGGIPKGPLVLKVTSIHSRAQRDIAEKEAKLLSRLSHPSIVKMYNACYRTMSQQPSGKRGKDQSNTGKERPQHLILMEYCEGGHALDVCKKLASVGQRFDLSTLIIAFGQICNAVSYLHAQRPPIVHRDLKLVNFLVKNGAYKLCDFGSAVFGHVDLRTPKARAEAEEVVQKTTTQMFRAPEMIDLFVAKKLTQSTDVWALGGCLYSLAFLKNCFEEGSNLAILSRKYTIPADNPYGDGLVELIDRMLTVDYKARADMTEVILCLSAVYSGRPLPPRKKYNRSSKSDEKEQSSKNTTETTTRETPSDARIGKFRTDSQGYQENIYDPTIATEGKKLASNSVAARRKRAAASSSAVTSNSDLSATNNAATTATHTPVGLSLSQEQHPLTFSSIQDSEEKSTSDVAFSSFADLNRFDSKGDIDFFQAFDNAKEGQEPGTGESDGFDADAFGATGWGKNAATNVSSSHEQDDGTNPVSTSLHIDDFDSNGETMKKDGSDNHRKKSRRKREGGGRSRANRDVEARIETLKINNNDNAGAGRRSKTSRGEEDKELRVRRRSVSRSRRKARGQRSATTKIVDEIGISGGSDVDKKPSRSNSIRNIFNRKQGNQEI